MKAILLYKHFLVFDKKPYFAVRTLLEFKSEFLFVSNLSKPL
jgi:hypothetical protein